MVAELKKILGTLNEEDVDIMDVDEMLKLLKKIILNMRGAEELAVPEPGEDDDDKDLIQAISNFGGKHSSKPSPWNGEDEKAFKSWTEKFTMYMSNAGDKKVNTLFLKSIGINTTVAEELQESLYDQFVQYTEGELLSDVQIAGPCLSFNSYRKAYHAGKKKTAENIHRARNSVSRPAIAENMDELEEKFKKRKKDIACLKDIDACDYRDNGMISILLDFVPDEVEKEISMKYATVGSNAIDIRTAMLEVERIIEREKDRVQSKRDRQTKGKISALQEEVAEDLHVWNGEANSAYGGFVLAAKRVRQGEEDEEEAQQERSVRCKVETETGEAQQRSGKAKGGKGKGSKGAESRKFFTWRRSARCAGTCPRRSSETGGIPDCLRPTKAKAKAKAEEKVARVKERGTFGILHRRWR